jgi:hypothetical protein
MIATRMQCATDRNCTTYRKRDNGIDILFENLQKILKSFTRNCGFYRNFAAEDLAIRMCICCVYTSVLSSLCQSDERNEAIIWLVNTDIKRSYSRIFHKHLDYSLMFASSSFQRLLGLLEDFVPSSIVDYIRDILHNKE